MATRSAEPTALFVYGTLLPGAESWHVLAPFVADTGTVDRAPGTLHDTGLGYPAASFAAPEPSMPPGPSWIHGRTFVLAVPRAALAVLDEFEDVPAGLYRRVIITTAAGTSAWAYEHGDGLTLTPIRSGSWFDRSDDSARP